MKFYPKFVLQFMFHLFFYLCNINTSHTFKKPMKRNLKILLADDHSVVRHGISLILKETFKTIETIHADSFKIVLEKLNEKPDLIFLDINLPGGNSTKMIAEIKKIDPTVLILMFSAFDEKKYAMRYIHAGANGYLKKDSPDNEIIKAVESVIKNKKYVSNSVKEIILENAFTNAPINPLQSLSNREIEVAEMIAKGEGNIEIANKLNVKMSTVSTFKTRIYQKLRIKNISGLIEILKIHED